ncbi:MAG: ATP-binding protein, partial [Acidimicrobiales bacterium]
PSTGLLGEVDPAGARHRLFDRAVTSLRAAADEQPVLILLDDLHWADRSSLELLTQLAVGSHTSRLLVVGAYRDTEVHDAFAGFLGALPSDTTRITLHGLTAPHVDALARTIPGAVVDSELVATLTQHTAGNPFFVKELVRLLVAQGRAVHTVGMPAGVREVLSRRLARLSSRCRNALGAGSVIGAEFDSDLLAAVLEAGRDELVEVLEEAVSARIVVEIGLNRFRFVHDLFRQAFYEGLGRAHRLRLHLAVGEAIEARHAPELDHHLGELARHFLASTAVGDPAKAVAYGRRAGERAAAMLAFDEAVDYFERALEAHPAAVAVDRARLLVALGDARWRARDIAGAREVLGTAADLARATDDAGLFAEAALAYGGGLGGNQPLASADTPLIALLDEALGRLPEDDSALRCRLMARLAVELYLTDARDRRASLSAEALAIAHRLDDPGCLATALYARQIAMFGPDGVEEREAAVAEMLELAATVGDRELELWGHLFRVWVLGEQCAPIHSELAVCANLAEQLGLPGYRAEVALRQAVNRLIAGEFDEADRLTAVVEAGAATDLAAGTTRNALTAMNAALKGPYEELAELVKALLVEQPEKVMWRTGLVSVYAELGRLDEARREFEHFAAREFDVPRDGLWMFAMHNLGCTCFALREAGHAATLEQLIAPHVDRATVAAFGSMATAFGLVVAAQRRFDDALRWLDVGHQRNLAMGNRAYALFNRREKAAVLLARGGPGDLEAAGALLTDLIAELRSWGFTAFIGRAESLATAAAAAPTPRADDTVSYELRRDDDGWTATFDQHTVHLRPSKGIDDLSVLLAKPGSEVAAVDLAGALTAADSGELLDSRARRELRDRLVDLENDVTEAEQFGDLSRAERARVERDTLVAELTAAVGLGGRPRRSGDVRERARKAVTWRIRQAIRTITDTHPPLGRHLDQSVRTGTFCVYVPAAPLTWRVQRHGRHR